MNISMTENSIILFGHMHKIVKAVSFVMFACPHKTRLPLGTFTKFAIDVFSKVCRENFSLVKIC